MTVKGSLHSKEKSTYTSSLSNQNQGEVKVDSLRKIAVIVGVLFLVAMVASLLGGGLIESVISAPDYLVAVSENETQLLIGVLLELVNGLAVLGIGILLYTTLRHFNETMALGYLGLRIVESVFCAVIVISPLSLITLSQDYLNAGAADASTYQAIGSLSIAGRESVASLLIPVFLGLGALLLYTLLYQTRLVPRFISVWGIIAAILILALNLLITFGFELGTAVSMLFALPIITNEIFLGFWLILKGFNSSVYPKR